MFDIGFSEIVIIAVVALVVLGPEKLPKTARTLGHLFGRLQRYVADVKADINREIELDELRKLQQQVRTAARDIETSMTTAAGDIESGVRAVESDLNAAAGGVKAEATGPAASPAPAGSVASGSAGGADPAPTAAATPASPAEHEAGASRQAALPGFERG